MKCDGPTKAEKMLWEHREHPDHVLALKYQHVDGTKLDERIEIVRPASAHELKAIFRCITAFGQKAMDCLCERYPDNVFHEQFQKFEVE